MPRPRRLALLIGALLSTGVVFAGCATFSGGNAASAQPSPIRHVIFVYDENHSFDNLFGLYCAAKPVGYCDGRTGNITMSGGTVYPTRSPAYDVIPQVCHTVACQQEAMNGGAMNGWDQLVNCQPTYPMCMQQFQPKQIPVLTWMADHGVLADEFFSEPNPSSGAHLFFYTGEDRLGFDGDVPYYVPAGYTQMTGWGCDSNTKGLWTDPNTGVVSLQWFCNPNEPSLPNGGAEGVTSVHGVPDFFTSILDPSGLSWTVYGAAVEFGSQWQWNPLPYQAAALNRDKSHLAAGNQILTDAENGTLPNVAIVSPFTNKYGSTAEHNGDSMTVGDNFLGQLLRALKVSAQLGSTAVILTYDDCGCFYDHVPPPPGRGPRTPLLIVSPWAKAGYVDHNVGQFSSILAFIEHNFGLPSLTSLNPVAQDGRVTDDLMGDFDFTQSVSTATASFTRFALPAQQPIPVGEQRWLRAHAHDSDDDAT